MSVKKKTRSTFFPTDPVHREQVMESKFKAPAPLKASTPTQKVLLKKLRQEHHDITFATGPAGTGKTYLATRVAIEKFNAGDYTKIVITRPNVSSGDDLGYLPGTLTEKMAPWTRPIVDVFNECFPINIVNQMIQNEIVEIAPIAFMRGRTFKNAIIIVDEAQNCTPEQMKMILTRIGEGSRMIVTGDTEQFDRRELGTVSGLSDFIEKIEAKQNASIPLPAFITDPEGDDAGRPAVHSDTHRWSRIGLVKFTRSDVVRHPVIEEVLELYG